MEIKPVEEEQKLNYPKDEGKSQDGKKKRIIKTWQKIAITGAVLTGLTVGGIAIYKTVTEPEEPVVEGLMQWSIGEIDE